MCSLSLEVQEPLNSGGSEFPSKEYQRDYWTLRFNILLHYVSAYGALPRQACIRTRPPL